MADGTNGAEILRDRLLPPSNVSRGGRNSVLLSARDLRGIINAASSRVVSGLTFADGTTGSVIGTYNLDVASGVALLGGEALIQATAADQELGADIDGYALDGSAFVELSADGKTYHCVVVLVSVSGTPTIVAVFGDEEDDGNEVEPTNSDIVAALAEASITGYEPQRGGLVLSRILFQRVATNTITLTVTNAATDADHLGERSFGGLRTETY